MPEEKTENKIDQIIDKYEGRKGVLIQLLLEIQRELNWIPREAVKKISERLKIPESDIYRVASFYTAMSLEPRGKYLVRVCEGTACYVRGAQRIRTAAERAIGVKAGETTSDLMFTLQTVNCLGCCALGPVVEINGKYYGLLTPKTLENIISHLRSEPS
ncbi:MAG: NADH-quinone oxidoreductase subunit NuoE [Nitrososphaerota archaeon]|nr:NADH-quinone oxidoreductase subunit NuoE [Candidatus Bathyarchaeota archaeon]MDW8023492.1 NADH-quinone oxidoreductase subunit NuoE [Nitrososphaerota archaeon]